MNIKISHKLQKSNDIAIARMISEWFFGSHDLEYHKNIFLYTSKNQLIWLLSYTDDPIKSHDLYDIFVHWLFVHPDINHESGKPLWLWSKLLYELFRSEKWKIISLRATQESLGFYEKIWFESLEGRKLVSNDISKIYKNLQKRMQSPRYISFSEDKMAEV